MGMDFEYSPHREAGGAFHLPSPTHAHTFRIEGFASINKLRRSLSRSPSKPSRFHLSSRNSTSSLTSHTSSSSPLAPIPVKIERPTSTTPRCPLPSMSTPPFHSENVLPLSTKKPKFTLRRTSAMRQLPRTRSSSRSPLRPALSESSDQGNAAPSRSRKTSAEEDSVSSGFVPIDQEQDHESGNQKPPLTSHRNSFELSDTPIKFDMSKMRPESNAPGSKCFLPVKSSPLKRSDGIMNLDQASLGSPQAKRRSLHGPSLGGDFNVFDAMSGAGSLESRKSEDEADPNRNPFASPMPRRTASPSRKPSLRRGTAHRVAPGLSKGRVNLEQERSFALPTQASRNRQRWSMDGALSTNNFDPQASLGRSFADVSGAAASVVPRGATARPHPLSRTLTASSSNSNLSVDSPCRIVQQNASMSMRPPPSIFNRSLPTGPVSKDPFRRTIQGDSRDMGSVATPDSFKNAKPDPVAFSTGGLLSKRNRLPDMVNDANYHAPEMPETPSKRSSFPPMGLSAYKHGHAANNQIRPEFGTPTTPFSPHPFNQSRESFGKGVSIFGTRITNAKLNRRASFASINGDDVTQSPSTQVESQSSNDDLPPTPTKPAGGRASRDNSLRSSMFGRRASLGPETFVPPSATDPRSPTKDDDATQFSITTEQVMKPRSPQTPHEQNTPPSASSFSLSIRDARRGSIPFNSSVSSFPPATPTGPRDSGPHFNSSLLADGSVATFQQSDVDTALTSRFRHVTPLGAGEFSHVYRVEDPIRGSDMCLSPSSSLGKVWAVKKSKSQYTGPRDRDVKLREVEILRALKGNEHVVSFADFWEADYRLYIQTEFCENGSLSNFLTTVGNKARLDDFRIWKILLELTLGVKHIHDSGFIHLDLKPANVLVDWEGVLKIGDFGIATPWPAYKGIEAEGDREYLGPEVLAGNVDKPADVFALGMIMLEIAGNLVLPGYGPHWQRLRKGDLSEVPSLTWSSDTTLARDESGDPVRIKGNESYESMYNSDAEDEDFKFLRDISPRLRRPQELVQPPNFMVDPNDPEALDKMVQWMICPEPGMRPTIDQVYKFGGVQWVEHRRRAGATIYEGTWGPADDVLNHQHDVVMSDAL
ncbi:kinase-like protein [Patellaria atrata CBS 101060]|uniref:Kinase-like protein n=1 Tax=Patellaria atrata CBS 101060 TaxID=1346257 RepID=A0A9P4VL18_9PEZI|nr:kinase-like protein [Patellaria atrata CBS 101060]